jgi:hypothetical protein
MLLNYTTQTSTEQTIAEIQKMLAGHNVSAFMTEYDGPQVSSVSFKINIDDKPMGFKLPCNWRAVQVIFKEKNGNRKHRNGRLEAKSCGCTGRAGLRDWQYQLVDKVRKELEK